MCIDVTAKRGAECNTDHNLVCMKPGGHHVEALTRVAVKKAKHTHTDTNSLGSE